MPEGEHAGPPVGLGQPKHEGAEGAGDEQGEHGDERDTADVQHAQHDAGHHEGRPHVGLRHDQQTDGGKGGEHRRHRVDAVAHPAGAAAQHVGCEQRHRELGDLRRLELQRTGAQPP